jgi:quercetin dioxygenase-like cupin family protein
LVAFGTFTELPRRGICFAEERASRMDKISLTALARQQLAAAHRSESGRAAHTVYGGHQHTLRQTLVALTAGAALADHDSPGEATLQVLQGRVELTAPNTSWDGTPGDHLVIPASRHGLLAVEDSVVLLTVAKALRQGPT